MLHYVKQIVFEYCAGSRHLVLVRSLIEVFWIQISTWPYWSKTKHMFVWSGNVVHNATTAGGNRKELILVISMSCGLSYQAEQL